MSSPSLAVQAFAMARNLDKSYFEYLKDHPEEAQRFAESMEFVTGSPQFSVEHFLKNYHFSALPADATFVDVGGSHGVVATEVAKAHPGIRCVVQDISEPTIARGRTNLPQELEGRVEFETHDFFEEQPRKGADVYFFRWVFHDWSDKYAVQLLQKLVPALKKGSRVVVNDVCLPPHGALSMYQERIFR